MHADGVRTFAAVAAVTLGALSGFGDLIDTASVFDINFDTSPGAIVRKVDQTEGIDIYYAGEWFPSGSCDLYVDGVKVGTSSGPACAYTLNFAAAGVTSYALRLASAEGEIRRRIAFIGPETTGNLVHTAAAYEVPLDAAPGQPAVRLKGDGTLTVAWSSRWSDGATGSTVTLYAGSDTTTKVAELVAVSGDGEDVYTIDPKALSLGGGNYFLTHYDGVKTETFSFAVAPGGGFILMIK